MIAHAIIFVYADCVAFRGPCPARTIAPSSEWASTTICFVLAVNVLLGRLACMRIFAERGAQLRNLDSEGGGGKGAGGGGG